MIFEEFAQEIEKHKQELAAEMAGLVIERRVAGYIDNSHDELSLQFIVHFETTVKYIRQSNPALWRDYYTEVGKRRFRAGYLIESVMATSQALYDTLQSFIDRQWPVSQHEKLNQKYHQRLQSMQTLSETTIRQIYVSKSYN